ncbi:hypothetical protein PHSY_001018 [Pseudozyma hubeiensis SY62]|uniref:Calcineurin-like phosphoesterase domain-containing protein n=1 Tax=Pseudozyma hubeiensis (strain SY62) TaxID=1305764 RepID=R9NXL1_PSEHS|nr:hypothetical protein PHSY_001018 [Pseudozyma hubeiensis SY62]GAC93453.1 hypothetical protein PHSY_001018 [Pseudozyma hubeiensis SY62]
MTSVTSSSKHDTRVYTEYDVSSPPAVPGPEWVRFVLISDTHSQTTAIPFGDVLLHAGDLTTLGQPDDFSAQVEWLKTLPHAHKIFTCGNHDFSACTVDNFYETRGRQLNAAYNVQDSPDDVALTRRILGSKNLADARLKYLDNEAWSFAIDRKETKHYSWKVWGSPWSPEFEDWAWNYKRGPQAREVHKDIPEDVDLLVTHTPPHSLGGLDKIHDGTPVGCEELMRKLQANKEEGGIRPKLHVFGHIHEARGVSVLQHDGEGDETVLVNAALVEYDQDMWNNHRKCECALVRQHQQGLRLDADPPNC